MARDATAIQNPGSHLDAARPRRDARSRRIALTSCVREHTAGDVIAGTFRIYGANFLPLLLCYLLPAAPFIVLSALGTSHGHETLVLAAGFLETLVAIFAIGAITIAVSDICLGNHPSVVRSYQMIARIFWRYLGAYLLLVITMVVAALFLVIPMFVAAALLLFALPVVTIERKGGITAVKRSVALGRGYYIRNYAVWFAAFLIAVSTLVIVSMLFGIFWVLMGFDSDGAIFNLLAKMIGAAFMPLWQIPVVLLYYDMRVRKEHFDQAALSQEIFT